MRLAIVLGCALSTVGAVFMQPNGVHAHGDAGAVVVAAVLEEVECQECETAWLGTPGAGGVYYFTLHHRLTGRCGSGGGLASSSQHASKQPSFVHTARSETTQEFETESYCARCGGTSSCHPEFQEGSCHLACGSGGGEVSWQAEQDLRTLLRAANFAAARELIDASDRLLFDASRSRVTVLGCEHEVFNVVSLASEVAEALVDAQ